MRTNSYPSSLLQGFIYILNLFPEFTQIVLWLISVGIIKFYRYFHTFPHELKLKSRNSFSEVFHTLNSYQQLHKGLYFTKFKSFRYSISLNRHPGVNYFKFWLKGGALSRRKSLNQLCCFVRNYRLYWFGFSWSLKGFKLIGKRIRFSLFRTVREKRRVIIWWGGGALVWHNGLEGGANLRAWGATFTRKYSNWPQS